MHLLGGKGLFLSSDDIQLGVNETLKDTALVLSRFNSIILARVYGHKDIMELGELATVPVINALSDKYHPLQMLADYLTVHEHFGKFEGLTFAWVGDGNNVLHDYMLAAPKLGANIQIATPAGYEPDQDVVEETKRLAALAGTKVVMTTDPVEAVKGANVVSTDTWISMGQEEESQKRLKAFAGYQVTNKMLENAADKHIFLHCLPRHQDEVHDEVRQEFWRCLGRGLLIDAVILCCLLLLLPGLLRPALARVRRGREPAVDRHGRVRVAARQVLS